MKNSPIQFLLVCCLLFIGAQFLASQEIPNTLPLLRQQAEIQQEWLKARLERVLPQLMREQKVHMWIIPMREYNEDPVFSSLVSPTSFAARRRTIFLFFDRGEKEGVEKLSLGGSSQGGLYATLRDTTLKSGEFTGKEQWDFLGKIVKERDPKTIAVNISHVFAFSDGLSAGEWEQLQEALGEEYSKRLVRAEELALNYISVRVPEMLPWFKKMMETAHKIIETAFSNKVITPGKTTTEDVVWWMRQKSLELGFTNWFQPSVSAYRQGGIKGNQTGYVIQQGDVLHCDFGITGMRLNTDTQHMGYVMKEGETEPPAGIQTALKNSNRLQDIVLENMKLGLTGNQVLGNSLTQMRKEGLEGTIYCHPIGEHGHGAGPLIGLWDRQKGVPGRGDVLLRPDTWYSIELQATSAIPEWGDQKISSAQEEDAEITADGKVQWILNRQTRFHLVR
ncbi:MAG: M24 family metallopeptidase [bacterium]